jgi:SAM-dependent methyltransferase
MLKYLVFLTKTYGVNNVALMLFRRIFAKKTLCFKLCLKLISNKNGLEIGGPSSVFRGSGILPVYSIVKGLDNCNFATTTAWENNLMEGINYQFSKDSALGQQYLCEATELSQISSSKYDFVLSSHMLEHTANPLMALSEWTRVLKTNGILILIVPHMDGTFDHKRPLTTLEHIIEDFKEGKKEDDLTHLPEIMKLHDLDRDDGAVSLELFEERSNKNFENRCFHHHVFNTDLTIRLLHHHHLQILAVESILPHHIITISQKTSLDMNVNNEIFLRSDASEKKSSPFPSDKH